MAGRSNAVRVTLGLALLCSSLFYQGFGHECERRCEAGQPPKECRYVFTLQPFITLSRSWCEGCPANASACLQPHCVTANGAPRIFLSVNRQLPGPAIQVCRGDTVSVEVQNRLPGTSEAALHWHGLQQRDSPHMDGVPMLTQCPIPAGANFGYRFEAAQAGTHFYHAHSVLQQADGIYGALIVREPAAELVSEPVAAEHVLLVAPWTETLQSGAYGALHGDLLGVAAPRALLVNGRGALNISSGETLQLVRVSARVGDRVLLRLVNAAAIDCPVRLSLQSHELLLRATAGSPLSPRHTKALHIFPGERYDVEVAAGPPGVYALQVHGLHACHLTPPQEAVFEVLAADKEAPSTKHAIDIKALELVSSDCSLVSGGGSSLCSADLEATATPVPLPTATNSFLLPFGRASALAEEPEFRFVLDDVAYFPTFLDTAAPGENSVRAPHLNHVTFRLPASPPLLHPEDEEAFARTQCETYSADGEESPARRPHSACRPAPHYCECTHILRVPLNASLQITLQHQTEHAGDPAQTLHLHGLRFLVTRWRAAGEKEWRDVKRPALRDTVTVPRAGAITINMLADNPGFWLLESRAGHVSSAGVGVAAILQVGDRSQLPAVPHDFPRCSGHRPDDLIF